MRRNSLQGFRKSDRKISGGQIYIKLKLRIAGAIGNKLPALRPAIVRLIMW